MHPLPHVYAVVADGTKSGAVELTSEGLSVLLAEPPPEFGGQGKQWSPEGLLCAALASCFILSFRAVARSARLEWQRLECKVEATLQRREGVLQFTHLVILATLTIGAEQDFAGYLHALERAEKGCLIANSLTASRELKIDIARNPAERPQLEVAACEAAG